MTDLASRPILDVCCGGRMFWFNKKHPNVVFADKRRETHKLSNGATLVVEPDVVHDFTMMPFKNNSFHLVIFDPPHTRAGKFGWMAKKYGSLSSEWRQELKLGVNECFRVLKTNGTLIFKWNESHFKVTQVIEAIGREPLFGHRTTQKGTTIWLAFMKFRGTK